MTTPTPHPSEVEKAQPVQGECPSERVRNAAAILDTLTSNLVEQHPLRVEAAEAAKRAVADLYALADRMDALQANPSGPDEPIARVANDYTASGLSCHITEYLPAGMPLYARPSAMPALTDAMRAVLRNERDVYGSEDALYAALVAAAGNQAQASAPAVQPGWKLVPVEPTDEWVAALQGVRVDSMKSVIADVLAAAPTPPAAVQEKAAPSDKELIAVGESVGLGPSLSVAYGRALFARHGQPAASVEPTQQMIDAGIRAAGMGTSYQYPREVVVAVWRAMQAAAQPVATSRPSDRKIPDAVSHYGLIDERVGAPPATQPAASVTQVGTWEPDDPRWFIWKPGIVRDSFPAGTPIYVGQPAASAQPLHWIPEDELPEWLPTPVYDALFPHSRIENGIREFPIYGPAPVAAQAQPDYPGATVADRLDAMADECAPGSQRAADLLAASTIWRKHLAGPAAQASGQDAAAELTAAARDVLAERRRQVEAEGLTPEHDDEHEPGGIAGAAVCYARHAWERLSGVLHEPLTARPYIHWPWAATWWKPTTPRRDLVKAAALILAEIERLDRAAARAAGGEYA
ncbi:hypothetical protein V8Z80_08235 [Orrella sp. JC864]|uniref:hypothetical protein n=1 Tax=Orrella sp. JC864 TaxID=3120298 RepID=UPI0030095DEE